MIDEHIEPKCEEIAQPSRRLIINRIAMENFKSYYGRLEIGPFHRRFTAIVGPNGSGKSNLIESLLFVFGKRANWMRLKSLHQLIHNSSAHSDVRKASVEVEFMDVEDRGADTIDLPHTKFSVRRTVNHTGQTQYHINDHSATLEEVTTLLMGKGIDLTNNRFLILQGEVEQISLMKPKSGDPEKPGLIEYLEDIIGSSQFQERIEQLSQDSERLEVMRRERGEIMRIVEGDLARLEPAKDKAIEYVRREKQGMQLQNVQIQVALFKLTSNRDRLALENGKLEDEQKAMLRESKERVKQDSESAKAMRQAKEQLTKIREERGKLQALIETFNHQDSEVRSQIKALSEQQHRCKKRIDEIIKDRNSCMDENSEAQQQLPALEKEVVELQKQRDAAEAAFKALDASHKEKTQEYTQQRKKIQLAIANQVHEKQKLDQQIDFMVQQHTALGGKGQDNSTELARIAIEIESKQAKSAELKAVLLKIEEVIRKIHLKCQEEQNRERDLGKQLQDLEQEIRAVRQAGEALQQTQTQAKDQNYTVKAILDAAARGQLPGVIGRIGDLGWIPPKYDVAATTSGLGGLNAILVENEDAAKRCLEFLKVNKIGRQGFFCLNKIRETVHIETKFQSFPHTQRLFDLITPRKEEYRVAFFKVYSNTLVCDTIDIARDIRYNQNKQVRIVTIDGKMVETTGVMSGGGQPKKGLICTNPQMTMSSGGHEGNISELKQKYDQLLAQKQQMEETMRKYQEERITTEREGQQIQRSFTERKRDRDQLEDDIEEFEQKRKHYQALAAKQANSSEERNHMEKEIESRRKQAKKVEDGYTPQQKEIDALTKKIETLESADLKSAKEAYQRLVTESEKLEERFGKLKSQTSSFEKRLKKYTNEEREQQLKLQKLEEEIAKHNETKLTHEEKCLIIFGKVKALEEAEKEQEQECEKHKAANAQLVELIQQIKAKINGIKERIEDNQNIIQKCGEEVKSLARRLDEVRSTYKDTVREYDFLQEIDEIANYTVQDVDKTSLEDFTLLNISMVEDPNVSRLYDGKGQLLDEDVPVKRRSNVVSQLQQLMEYEVMQNLTPEQLELCCPIEKEIVRVIAHVQAKTNEAAKETNIQDINTYKSKFLDFKEKKQQLDKVKDDVAANKIMLEQLKKERQDMFMAGFNVIAQRLKETYQTLTTGGDAELELVDTMDPFSEGVSFSVRPKNKSWKQMSKLSGGEKTLSSLSLIFALHYFRPTPLYFFDEVDAALDYRNVQIIGNFVKERTKNAQFIVISLRNNMFELANKLVGIYKTFDITKSISVMPALVQQRMLTYQANEDSENSRHLANHQ